MEVMIIKKKRVTEPNGTENTASQNYGYQI